MILFLTFLPFFNFLLFALFGSFVHRKQLIAYTIASMCSVAPVLFLLASPIVSGSTYTASLGVWAVSGLFEIN